MTEWWKHFSSLQYPDEAQSAEGVFTISEFQKLIKESIIYMKFKYQRQTNVLSVFKCIHKDWIVAVMYMQYHSETIVPMPYVHNTTKQNNNSWSSDSKPTSLYRQLFNSPRVVT